MGQVDFLSDFGGVKGFDFVATGVHNIAVNWRTRPVLDTNSISDWPGGESSPLDYDGIPPLEYVNGAGWIYRVNPGDYPFPCVAIDTVVHDYNWNGPKKVDTSVCQ